MRSVTATRAAVLALVVASVASCSRAPRGVAAVDLGDETHGHRFDSSAGKILFVKGAYPHKSYFCAYDPLTGSTQKVHFAGYTFVDSDYAYLPESQEAVVAANTASMNDSGNHVFVANVAANGSLANFTSQGAAAAPADRLLHVSFKDGVIAREIPLASDTSIVAIGRAPGAKEVFALLSAGGKTFLKEYDPVKKAGKDSTIIGDFATQHAAFSDRKPVVVLDAKDASLKRWLVFYDLRARKIVAKSPEAFGLDDLVAFPEATLARYSPSGDLKAVVARLDWDRHALLTLTTLRGSVESMIPGGKRVFIAGRDPIHPGGTLTVAPLQGGGEEAIAWTSRPGRFFGYDPRGKSLLFATQSLGSVWSVATDREALSSIAAEVESGTARSGWRQGLFLILMIAGSATVVSFVYLASASFRSD